jgi:hypothetical protein
LGSHVLGRLYEELAKAAAPSFYKAISQHFKPQSEQRLPTLKKLLKALDF